MTPFDASEIFETDGRPERRVVLTPASEIHSEAVTWLWAQRMPRRALVVVAGEPGLGKSVLVEGWVAARASRGELEGELLGHPRHVVIANAEDDWRSVLKPRLVAHGADLERVHRIEVAAEDDPGVFTLPADVRLLTQAIDALNEAGRAVGLVVVDPIGAFIAAELDSHREAAVRRVLAPLAALAEARDLTIVVVVHLNKDETKRLLLRIGGSIGFGGAARSVLAVVRDPDDPEGEQGHERVIAHVKTNWGRYASSLAATVDGTLVEIDDGSVTDTGHLALHGESPWTIDRLQERSGRRAGGSAEEIEESILDVLDEAGGTLPSVEAKTRVAQETGRSEATIKRAMKRLSERGLVIVSRDGFQGETTWTRSQIKSGQSPGVS